MSSSSSSSSSAASAQKEALLAALADSVTIKNVNAPASHHPSASASSSSSSISGEPRMTSTRKGNQGHTHQSASLSVPLGPRRTNSAAESNSNSTSSPPSHSRSNSSNAIPNASNPFASPKEKKDATKKKSSRHADIIDKLDPSGFWGTGMFHHESAYDAAAPSRNKSNAAPMRAFDVTPGGTAVNNSGGGGGASSSYPPSAPSSGAGAPKLSPLAQHTLKEMGSVKFEDRTPTGGNGVAVEDLGYFSHSGTTSAGGATPDSPSGGRARKNSKDLKKTRSRSKERAPAGEEDYMNARAKEQKNALANAWGVADPEPFEDYGFMAATEAPRGETGLASASSSIWNGQEGYSAPKASGVGGIRNGMREVNLGQEYDFQGGDEEEILDSPIVSRPPVASNNSGGVKRTKSLIQRIRNMRNNPNVPLSPDEPPATSPGLPPSPGHNSHSHSMSNSTSSNNFRSSSPSTYDDLSSSANGGGVNYSSSPPTNNLDINGNPRRTSFLNRATRGSPPPPLPIRASYSNNNNNNPGGAGGPSPPTSANSNNSLSTSDDYVHVSGSSSTTTNPRTRSRSETQPPPPSSTRDKSLPRIPLDSPAEEDPFSDPSAGGAASHHSGGGGGGGRTASNAHVRTPPPPVAPIPVPGAAGGYFPRTRTFEEQDQQQVGSAGSGGGGGAKLGRKGSLMKRVLGRG